MTEIADAIFMAVCAACYAIREPGGRWINTGGSPRVSSHQFADVDEFREHLTGWDTEVTQLSRGMLGVGWDQILWKDLVVAHLQVDGRWADVSAIDPGITAIVVALAPSLLTCGIEIDQGSMIMTRAGREHRSAAPERWESFEIAMSIDMVDELGLLEKANLPKDLPPERSVLPLDEAYVRAFRALAHNLLAPCQLGQGLSEPLMLASAIRERIVELLSSAIESSATRHSGSVSCDRSLATTSRLRRCR